MNFFNCFQNNKLNTLSDTSSNSSSDNNPDKISCISLDNNPDNNPDTLSCISLDNNPDTLSCISLDNNPDTLNKLYYKLKDINDKDIPYFSFKNKIFNAMPCNIYDGDTFSIMFYHANQLIKYKTRMLHYDSAEMKPLLSNPNRIHEKELANLAKDRLKELLNKHPTKLIKVECYDFDKYGRILINAWNMVDTDSINNIMIKEGHGKLYEGGTKEKW